MPPAGAPGGDPTDWFSAKDEISQDLSALKRNEIGQCGRKLCCKQEKERERHEVAAMSDKEIMALPKAGRVRG